MRTISVTVEDDATIEDIVKALGNEAGIEPVTSAALRDELDNMLDNFNGYTGEDDVDGIRWDAQQIAELCQRIDELQTEEWSREDEEKAVLV